MSALATAAVAPPRLGDLLLRYNLITQPQLEIALQQQKTSKKRLGAILIDQGIVTEDQVNYVLSEQLHLPYMQLTPEMVDPVVIHLIPQELLEKYQAVPLILVDDELTVAMVDPTDQEALAEFTRISGCKIKPAIGLSSAIKNIITGLEGKRILSRSKAQSALFDFEHLEVYQATLELADIIFKVTRKFPKEIQNSLGDSLREQTLSMLKHITQNEGKSAQNDIKNCIPMLMLAMRNRYIDEPVYAELRTKCLSISNQLTSRS